METMTTRKTVVIRILLFLARWINDDSGISKELSDLVIHINVQRWEKP